MRFSERLAGHVGYEVKADVPDSRVVLLVRPGVEPRLNMVA
jgi:hypothetical protein